MHPVLLVPSSPSRAPPLLTRAYVEQESIPGDVHTCDRCLKRLQNVLLHFQWGASCRRRPRTCRCADTRTHRDRTPCSIRPPLTELKREKDARQAGRRPNPAALSVFGLADGSFVSAAVQATCNTRSVFGFVLRSEGFVYVGETGKELFKQGRRLPVSPDFCWYCKDKVYLSFTDMLTYPRPIRKFQLLLARDETLGALRELISTEVGLENTSQLVLTSKGEPLGDDSQTIRSAGLAMDQTIVISKVAAPAADEAKESLQNRQFVGDLLFGTNVSGERPRGHSTIESFSLEHGFALLGHLLNYQMHRAIWEAWGAEEKSRESARLLLLELETEEHKRLGKQLKKKQKKIRGKIRKEEVARKKREEEAAKAAAAAAEREARAAAESAISAAADAAGRSGGALAPVDDPGTQPAPEDTAGAAANIVDATSPTGVAAGTARAAKKKRRRKKKKGAAAVTATSAAAPVGGTDPGAGRVPVEATADHRRAESKKAEEDASGRPGQHGGRAKADGKQVQHPSRTADSVNVRQVPRKLAQQQRSATRTVPPQRGSRSDSTDGGQTGSHATARPMPATEGRATAVSAPAVAHGGLAPAMGEAQTAAVGHAAADAAAFCHSCGKVLVPGANFCSTCGARVAMPLAVPAASLPPPPLPPHHERSVSEPAAWGVGHSIPAIGAPVAVPPGGIPLTAVSRQESNTSAVSSSSLGGWESRRMHHDAPHGGMHDRPSRSDELPFAMDSLGLGDWLGGGVGAVPGGRIASHAGGAGGAGGMTAAHAGAGFGFDIPVTSLSADAPEYVAAGTPAGHGHPGAPPSNISVGQPAGPRIGVHGFGIPVSEATSAVSAAYLATGMADGPWSGDATRTRGESIPLSGDSVGSASTGGVPWLESAAADAQARSAVESLLDDA